MGKSARDAPSAYLTRGPRRARPSTAFPARSTGRLPTAARRTRGCGARRPPARRSSWTRTAPPARARGGAGRAAIVVYTDGSHVKGTARRGIGAYCAHGGREYRMRRDCAGLDAAASNPTLELLAAVDVLRSVPAAAAPAAIEIAADYIGVARYVNGEWTPKAGPGPFAAAARALADVLARLRARGFVVSATHVRAHSGVPGNEEADRLAKAGAAGADASDFAALFGE